MRKKDVYKRQDLDADTKARLEQGARIVEVLKQSQNAPVPVEKQVAILYAVTKGILENVKVEDVNAYEAGLYTYLDADAAGLEVMQLISTTGKLEPETEEKLRHVLEVYTENFLNTRPEDVYKRQEQPTTMNTCHMNVLRRMFP